jgi:hypothetical protein
MKKFIVASAAVLTLISSSAFAGHKDFNPAENTFQNQFKGATDVKWKEGKETIKASFALNGFHVEAYFSYTGELIGTARNVIFNQLPLAVVKEIDTRYGSAAVYDIIEYNSDSETFYQMTVELPTKKLLVRVTSGGDISVVKKIKIK